MKSFVLSCFEELALKEVFELVGIKGKIAGSGVVEFEAGEGDLAKLISHGQSFRKVLAGLCGVSDLKKVNFFDVEWKDHFFKGMSFKVEVEGVLGSEERLKIGKEIGSKIFVSVKNELGFELGVEMKKPDVIVLVYFDGEKYFLGIDVSKVELDKRQYRVFVNSASFKGDLAYYLVRKSGFVVGDRLVVGFVKDGTLAIEAGIFSFNKKPTKTIPRPPAPQVYGFDNNMVNIKAARKNAKIAGVSELMELNKFDLDELDVKFSEGSVDRLIFQITRKDEDKLNEIYYQANYVLRKKGTLLIVCRSSWEVTFSERFKLLSSEEIKRGGSSYKVWVMEKK